jgi:hypothetical protein
VPTVPIVPVPTVPIVPVPMVPVVPVPVLLVFPGVIEVWTVCSKRSVFENENVYID